MGLKKDKPKEAYASLVLTPAKYSQTFPLIEIILQIALTVFISRSLFCKVLMSVSISCMWIFYKEKYLIAF